MTTKHDEQKARELALKHGLWDYGVLSSGKQPWPTAIAAILEALAEGRKMQREEDAIRFNAVLVGGNHLASLLIGWNRNKLPNDYLTHTEASNDNSGDYADVWLKTGWIATGRFSRSRGKWRTEFQ